MECSRLGTPASGRAADDRQTGADFGNRHRVGSPSDEDRQRFSRGRVDDGEHAELPPVMGLALDEVMRPDVLRPLGAQTDAQSVCRAPGVRPAGAKAVGREWRMSARGATGDRRRRSPPSNEGRAAHMAREAAPICARTEWTIAVEALL
jgi:hypothetical protein